MTKKCGRCGEIKPVSEFMPRGRSGCRQSRCRACHAAGMREWRAGRELSEEQKRRDTARSYANVYQRRGRLVPQPCQVCGGVAQKHHPDYSRPLDVVWLCRSCHLEVHAGDERPRKSPEQLRARHQQMFP
jgi:hypothetical protein